MAWGAWLCRTLTDDPRTLLALAVFALGALLVLGGCGSAVVYHDRRAAVRP